MVKTPIEEFSYDEVSNILSLKRRGHNNLTFYYGNDGNMLLSITEDGEDADLYDVIEFSNRASEITNDPMLYDANGNLIKDAYRYISSIKYNILNLPDTIQFSNGHQIVNLYDASGRKYMTVYYTNMRTVATDYNEIAYYTYDTDSVEYQKMEYLGNIMSIRTKEDTVITDKQKIFNTTGYYANGRYYHYVKNHLGSICLVIESETDSVVQNTSYLASGIPSSTNLNEQPYLYNGKEFVGIHGLNEYDSQARWYYAPIMRTTTMDPLAEEYYHISPYAWCGNNPIAFVDLGGDSTRLWVETRGLGHTWITTGEGDNAIVYSYGRYDDLGKDKEYLRNLTIEGDGVLLRLTGEDAKQYQKDKIEKTNPINIVIPDITDIQMQVYFDEMFYRSSELPSKMNGKYYLSPSAHVIDTYHLLYNNCTTKSTQAINALGFNLFYDNTLVPSPNGKEYYVTGKRYFMAPFQLYLYLQKK